MIRIFIGIELDEETQGELGKEISYLKSHAQEIRWIRDVENLHVTAKFVGDVLEKDLNEVFETTKLAAQAVEPFTLEVSSLSLFPTPEKARVVAAGCSAGAIDLERLAAACEDEFEDIGYPREKRPFRSHITIGRIKHPSFAQSLIPVIEDSKDHSYGCVDVSNLVVFMSESRKSGATYTPMFRTPLGEIK